MDIKEIEIDVKYESVRDYSSRTFFTAHAETATLAVVEVSRVKHDLIQDRDGA